MRDQVNQLRALLPKLSRSDANFAGNLIASYDRYGSLTAAQAPWIGKLIARAETPQPQGPQIAVGDFKGVLSLFATAQQHLKFPKLNLACEGKKVILSVAGPRAKTPGVVNVAGEGQFPNREFFGRVTPAGAWEPFKTTPVMQAALTALLAKLAADPAGWPLPSRATPSQPGI